MKIASVTALICLTWMTAYTQEASAIEGYWMNEDKEYIVQVYQKNDLFYGKVVWLADSLDQFKQPTRDVMNDDPELRSQQVKGLDVLSEFEYDNGQWRNGEVYNYKTGNDYNAKLRLDNEGNLRLTGYYGIFFMFAKTKVWTPVSDPGIFGMK